MIFIPNDFNLAWDILISFEPNPGRIVTELLIIEIFRLSQEKFPLLKILFELYAISAAISTPDNPAPTTTI